MILRELLDKIEKFIDKGILNEKDPLDFVAIDGIDDNFELEFCNPCNKNHNGRRITILKREIVDDGKLMPEDFTEILYQKLGKDIICDSASIWVCDGDCNSYLIEYEDNYYTMTKVYNEEDL